MAATERKVNQNSPSPSERMTEAWRKMSKTDQLQFYMAINQQKIKNLKIDGEKVNGYEHVAEYLRALQEFIKPSR